MRESSRLITDHAQQHRVASGRDHPMRWESTTPLATIESLHKSEYSVLRLLKPGRGSGGLSFIETECEVSVGVVVSVREITPNDLRGGL